jgi:SWI/SNF-related matrix-associated actin-dependent regulator of chromatin subfamily A member 5
MKNINILARTNGGEGATSATNAKVLSNLVMQLRKCCLHPFLFDGAEVNTDETTCEDLIAASGKLAVLDMLLRSLYEKKHRVVLFSQFTRVLDILDDYCTMRGFKRCRFDGSTARTKRNHVVNQFNAEGSDCFVFLMSTRSGKSCEISAVSICRVALSSNTVLITLLIGGMGLNLQTADTCILFDSDWNPQPDLQAMARVHRIGQKKTVHVYRLVCGGTIEERMVERAQKKLYLDQMVNQDSLVGLEDGEELGGVSKDELLKTLKFGCDAVFGGDVENQNTLPTLEDIDLITDRNRSNDLSEASGKLKGATSTFADFKAEGDFTSTTKLGGIDFKEIRDKHRKTFKDMGGIADSWSKLQKRIRKNRIVQVKGKGSGYGAAFVPVLASNNYDLENGESSVFQRELSESKGNYGDIKRRVKRSGVDFESQDHCQVQYSECVSFILPARSIVF